MALCAVEPIMPASITIDFVSDVSCPWCAIGLAALTTAIARLPADTATDLRIQPFELNPHMPPGGEDITAHLTKKYGSTPAQQATIRDGIRQRGAALGFEFRPQGRDRIYNTFNAHRLLHWAGLRGAAYPSAQYALKQQLLTAYFTDGHSPESIDTLLDAAARAGLDRAAASDVLRSDAFADAVRVDEARFARLGIQAVPATILNGRYLISGGQAVEVFERALRQALEESTALAR